MYLNCVLCCWVQLELKFGELKLRKELVAFGQLCGIGKAGQWNQAFDFKEGAEIMALVGSRLLLPSACYLSHSTKQ